MTPRATCLRWLGMTLLLAAATAIVFVLFPRLDLVVSRVFRSGSVAFPIEKTEAGRLARSTMIALTDGAMLTIVAAMLLAMLVPTLRVVRPRVLAFAASVYLLVPGLLVNGLLKRHWGRARPRQSPSSAGMPRSRRRFNWPTSVTGTVASSQARPARSSPWRS